MTPMEPNIPIESITKEQFEALTAFYRPIQGTDFAAMLLYLIFRDMITTIGLDNTRIVVDAQLGICASQLMEPR